MQADSVVWNVLWCLDGWHLLYKMVQDRLPEWARLSMVDPSRPLEEQTADAQVLVPTTGIVSAMAIEAAKDLQLIVQPASGYNNIAWEAAKARGIPVCTSPGVNAQAVAEAALMTVFMLAKRVKEQQVTFEQRGLGQPLGHNVQGKMLGIVGLGNVGKQLQALALGVGMQVVATASKHSRSDFEALLQQADFVSLHCPLNDKTRGLIGWAGQQELAAMKPGAMLLNFARGDVVDKVALQEALESGHLGGAGLDVHWQEPADPTDAIYRCPNVVALPHAGVCAVETFEAYAELVCGCIERCREGRPLLGHQL